MSKKNGVQKPPKIARKPGKTEISGTKGVKTGSEVGKGKKPGVFHGNGRQVSGHMNPWELEGAAGFRGKK